MNWLWIALAGTASGILGAMGMGGGGILIIYLTLMAGVEQGVAQGINLIFFLPTAVVALIYYIKKKMIVWKTALPCAALGVVGAYLGTLLSGQLQNDLLGKLFGALLLLMGLKQLFSKDPKKQKDRENRTDGEAAETGETQ